MQTDGNRRPAVAALGSPGDPKWHVDHVFVLVALAGLLVARIPLIPIRSFDPDEFEHSHAAWCVFKGLLPYKDFFEHHTPWYYFALSPFFHWFQVDQSFESARKFLLFGRGLSLVLTVLSTMLIFLVGRIGADRKVGLVAGLFLVGQPVLIQKTLEIRPDVLALPFFLGGLYFLLRGLHKGASSGTPSLRWFLGGGMCLGAAVMCTQKMLFVLPGVLTGLGFWALASRHRMLRCRILAVLLTLVGIAIPTASTWGGFAIRGGGYQFIFNNFLLNARWRQHSDEHLLVTLETSWPILVLCLLGACESMYRFYRSKQRRYGEVMLLCTLGGLIAGILFVPAAYKQYYLPPLTIACLFAAKGLCALVELAKERARPWLLVSATVPLLVWPVADLRKSFTQRDDRQMARLRYVFEHTAPADPVLDGWLGTAVFRPHPLYYFFMHGELMAMLSEKDVGVCLDALESGRVRPSLITLDDELPALGSRFMRFLLRNYVSNDGLFYRPRPGLGRLEQKKSGS
jgi:4-amino-4-deoxy-L-arabinose transferase-like glycosyltransferase